MAAKTRKASHQPERKWGPFHGGVGIAIWLNQTETEEGTKYFRSLTIAPRRYIDKTSGDWKDSPSLRPADIPALILGLQAAHDFMHSTPLPGQALELDDSFNLEELEVDKVE